MHPAIFFQITLRQPAHARLMDIIFEAGGTGFIWYGRVAPPRRKTSRKSLNHSSPFFLKTTFLDFGAMKPHRCTAN